MILLFIISVLCFVIHLELQRSCKYFITRNSRSLSIIAHSLDNLLIKSVIINGREIKLDKAFFRNYTIFVDGNDSYLVDLKRKANRGDIILQRDDVFFVKNGLNYVIDSKFCYVLNSSMDLESNNIDHFIISFPRRYIQKKYYVLDLKTKIKPGRI